MYEEKEHYVMMSIVKLLDVMVGNEPFLDFESPNADDKPDDIKAIERKLDHLGVIENYLNRVCFLPDSIQ